MVLHVAQRRGRPARDREAGRLTVREDVLLQLRAISTLYADQVEGATATLRHKSLAADAEQRGIAKKMQAKTFAAYPNVDRPPAVAGRGPVRTRTGTDA